MHFFICEVAARPPFHVLPYHYEIDANHHRDELNRAEARKEDGTIYETVTSLTLSIEEDREAKYRQEDD